MENKECRSCRYWAPRYQGVGTCRAEGRVGAKLWVADEKGSLLTISSFSCQSWQEIEPVSNDTV